MEIRAARLDNIQPSAEALAQEIANAFSFKGEQATPTGLLAAMVHQPVTVLLLDNFESVASSPEARRLIRDLIHKVPLLRLLVTGREAVRMTNLEQKVEIDGLATAEARTLFIRRAQRVQPGWEPLGIAEEKALTEILNLTESIPLALELVAAGMDPDVLGNIIAVRDSLRTTPRPAPPPGDMSGSPESRHQSLTHCLDWSYQRLPATVQDDFARLGLFVASFSEESVEQACGISQPRALLIRLMQASLLQRDDHQSDRYRLLRPTLDIVQEKLKEHPQATAIQQALIEHYADLIYTNKDGNLPSQKAVLKREWRNALGAADLASLTDNWSSLARFADGMRNHLYLSMYASEAIRLQELARQSARNHKDVQVEANCVRSLGDIALLRSDHGTARQRFEEAQALYQQTKDVTGEANCIMGMGDIVLESSDHKSSRQHYEQSLSLFQQESDRRGEADCIKRLGDLAFRSSDYDAAGHRYEEALSLYRQEGSMLGEANCLLRMGDHAFQCSKHDAARQRYEQALPLYQHLGDRLGEANSRKRLGYLAQARSEFDEARSCYEHVMPIYQEIGVVQEEANCIHALGEIALAHSDHVVALRHYERAMPLYRRIGDILGEANCINGLGNIALERSDYKDARQRFEKASALFEQLGHDHGRAITLFGLGNIALDCSDYEVAQKRYEEAVPLFKQVRDVVGAAACIQKLGDVARGLSHHDAARKHYEEALSQFRYMVDVLGEADCIRGMGDIAVALAKNEVARQDYEQALDK